MSDVALAQEPTSRQLARREASAPGRVTGKLRVACDAMVYDGLPLDEAAKAADLPTRRLRLALAKPHVLQYLRREREVLRASVSGSNILELDRIKRSSRNDNARVNAIKTLEQLGDEQQTTANRASPGLVVVIQNTSVTPHYQQIEAKPLQTNVFGPTARVGTNE